MFILSLKDSKSLWCHTSTFSAVFLQIVDILAAACHTRTVFGLTCLRHRPRSVNNHGVHAAAAKIRCSEPNTVHCET